jgi:hypothetical protein
MRLRPGASGAENRRDCARDGDYCWSLPGIVTGNISSAERRHLPIMGRKATPGPATCTIGKSR